MSLYAIGDTHLSLGVNKPMDIFGGGWAGYVEKLREGFSQIGPEDTVVLCGDLSWGMSLEQAREDFAFLDSLPGGRKILLKGNHDYWWTTAAKMEKFFAENGAKRVVPLAVSAPSHCPMMQSAADKLKEALSSITLKDAAIPVYCNAYAKPLTAKDEIVKALILQLVGPVRWVECVKAMQSDGVSALIECGPGKVLCGLNRKIDKSLDLANICDEDSLNKAIELIK